MPRIANSLKSLNIFPSFLSLSAKPIAAEIPSRAKPYRPGIPQMEPTRAQFWLKLDSLEKLEPSSLAKYKLRVEVIHKRAPSNSAYGAKQKFKLTLGCPGAHCGLPPPIR
ncbi:MAG: hypothetical protein ACRECZ_04400 [Methylocella sp.]